MPGFLQNLNGTVIQIIMSSSGFGSKYQIEKKKNPEPQAPMDGIVDELSSAYDELVAATAGVLEARSASGEQKTAETDATLVGFKKRWETFQAVCDRAEEMVERARHRIGSELLVDEATGATSQAPASGVLPINASRLEQTSKAVRWLVLEIQRGAGSATPSAAAPPPAAASPSSSSLAPSDARFSEEVPLWLAE
ncbi:mediator of RNA polymerase II transcription subunit 32-like isoform X2 [Phoenix dactylifera]|uniref:Mediator of RNA polymerase II transcription subunit 32-like isoform X2 n=1 Tax=Phoenix dactylifera TaxID=42345 RepID=A0A8B8J283_PHODC|nr:mediator of RNA polymerase II transcription subunit 32-like isoform X2 [Phoenix dactylifera]XP_026659036.2 mediator of RNA polymerase II transcription subunit 32-like isoform X2 [Phoenix dactylifera]XP_026659037.2 mediator of RNA polymerase II transcription subunit 32-like isoform X2 [Phoenix dactylifera]XP_026659038.2 mediator of RNA polymerase II transcription subunit 32-like isoform X2 [Phoenix dactylifera]XP_026659039.2 mediator of RNA polymerase II transcription subunit 32-like isoform 